ncbi:MAG: hypothetical protein JNK15_10720 [Planctomycetes bacterium]|nr:hypothetical protein [Planctomycetota bacterium]
MHRTRRFGWWSLLVWLSLGLLLEALHGFKVGWYLDVGNDTRRLMLTLAHTHGTLLALVNLALAATLRPNERNQARLARAAACLRVAAVLMPLGFVAGGVQLLGADPGYGVALVPVGAIFLLVGVATTARVASQPDDGSADRPRG